MLVETINSIYYGIYRGRLLGVVDTFKDPDFDPTPELQSYTIKTILKRESGPEQVYLLYVPVQEDNKDYEPTREYYKDLPKTKSGKISKAHSKFPLGISMEEFKRIQSKLKELVPLCSLELPYEEMVAFYKEKYS